jgi:hypothetical protein
VIDEMSVGSGDNLGVAEKPWRIREELFCRVASDFFPAGNQDDAG